MSTPILYTPALEHPEADEAATIDRIAHTLRQISETTSADYGHAVRSVHAKSHAILRGTFTVLDGLAPPYAQGLFARPASYPVVARLSTAPGDMLPDTISAPRGLALKVLGVPGERVPGGEPAQTQDFVLIDTPAFGAADAKHFAPQLALIAKTVDKAEGLKVVLSAILRALEGTLEALGTHSGALQAIGGRTLTHPLGDRYFSQTPYLFGQHVAKWSLVPASANLIALHGHKLALHGRADALREDISAVTAAAPTAWELRAQLCTDADKMPIENASVVWDETESPYVAVARVEFPAQPAWTAERGKTVDDGLAFTPWNALAAHRPLGSINRVRGVVYAQSAQFRGQFNGCPIHEPKTVEL